MKTIPAAMTWELLRRGRWNFVLTTLTAIGFPALIVMALRRDGLVDVHDKSMLLMQLTLLQIVMFACGAALFGAVGKWPRLYAYPARTSQLVAWRLLPMMAIIALEVIVCICLLNWLFDFQWPVLGPALLAAVAL